LLNELINFISAFWVIFSFSFLVALTGAMSPGPLLTYTIIKSARTSKHGYLMGLWIIIGHAILEMGIVILLLLGFSFILKNIIVIRIIGIIGGVILVLFGLSIVRDVYFGKISTDFLNPPDRQNDEALPLSGKGLENPVIGGIMVSMSNPYWWIWWATIGLAFMIQFGISFREWPKLIAFFLGHEAGDLVWYMIVSTFAFFGLRRLNKKAYYGILIFCAIFMIMFGIYLGISPFLHDSM
jgi:threonine/homoserine/homoserine lactone efflux protein